MHTYNTHTCIRIYIYTEYTHIQIMHKYGPQKHTYRSYMHADHARCHKSYIQMMKITHACMHVTHIEHTRTEAVDLVKIHVFMRAGAQAMSDATQMCAPM